MVRKTLKEIAELVGGEVLGDERAEITGIKTIEEAGEGDLTLARGKYLRLLAATRATAVLLSAPYPGMDKNMVIVADPSYALAKLLGIYYPEEEPRPGISPNSYIEPDASVSPEAVIFPGVYIGRRTRLARGVVVYPGVSIGNDVEVGEDTVIYSNVTIYRRSIIGRRVIIHAGVVIGGDGFGYAGPGRDNLKIPQVGYVQIDDEVEIGANSTIDRGTLGKTWIQRGVKIDNLVQIGHNVVIGEGSIIVAQVGIAGSTKLGRSVLIGGQAGLTGHITLGDGVKVAAGSGVHKDVAPQKVVAGSPHVPHGEWLRREAALARLPELIKTIRQLQDRIVTLEEGLKKNNG